MLNTFDAPENLKYLWRFDGNFEDSVGYKNGTLNGDVSFADGKINKCAYFNGGYINIPLNITLSDWTIHVWCKIGSYINYAPFIMNRNNLYSYGIAFNSFRTFHYGFIVQYYYNGGLTQYAYDTSIANNLGWHHYIFTSSNNIFVDGVKYAMYTQVSSSTDNKMFLGPDTLIGFDKVESDRKLHGYLEQLAIYDRVLSDSECFSIYNNGYGVYM